MLGHRDTYNCSCYTRYKLLPGLPTYHLTPCFHHANHLLQIFLQYQCLHSHMVHKRGVQQRTKDCVSNGYCGFIHYKI